MNKTLRIFAKDTRHLWLEILLSLALVAGFAATGHIGWPQFWQDPFREAKVLQLWIEILMPISWWLLLSRAVQDESLVGDRQFWITRPYGWPRVLAAKFIFITVYILLPYLLAQWFLLHQARLHPLAVLPGLAFTLLMLFGFFLLPLIALATVTPTITRMFLIFFALAVYGGLVTYLASTFLPAAAWVPGRDPRYPSVVCLLIPVVALGVTFLQYARRRTPVSAALLITLLAAFTAGCIAGHVAAHHISDFPALAAGEQYPITIAFNPDPKLQTPLAEDPKIQNKFDARNENPVDIPILFSGIAPGHAVSVDAEMFTISAPGMETRTVPWSYVSGGFFNRNTPEPRVSSNVASTGWVQIPLWMYREFAGRMVNIHVTYAVSELEAESPVDTPLTDHTVEAPQHGHCGELARTGELMCQYALTGPNLTRVAWKLKETCDTPSTAISPREEWIGRTDPGIRELDLNPVVTSWFSLSTKDVDRKTRRVYTFCPGDSLTFTEYHLTRKRLLEVTLPPVDPRLYVQIPSQLRNVIEAGNSAPHADQE